MDLPEAIDYCLSKHKAEETTPFTPDILVFKIVGKMFAATNPDEIPNRINLKCDPEYAIDLRDRYESIQPGYHMNKRHWNTLTLDNSIPPNLIKELIDHSYELVVAGLTKKQRESL